MRRQRDVVCLGHAGNLETLADAASVRQVRLHDRQPALVEHPLELEARVHALTRCQRNRGHLGQARVVLRLLGQHRLFDEQGTKRLQFAQ